MFSKKNDHFYTGLPESTIILFLLESIEGVFWYNKIEILLCC